MAGGDPGPAGTALPATRWGTMMRCRATANTSSMVSTGTISMRSRTSFGISSRFFTLLAGNTMVRNPARYAASAFSRSPPTWSTLPRRLTSPDIATSRRIGRSLRTEAMTSPTVMPAEGPSFGTPAAGKWMCAACTLSRMTSPSWPVVTTRPDPGILSASTTRISPPVEVHARPAATPTSSLLPTVSGVY